MSKSDSIGTLAAALAKVQAQIENAQKTRLASVKTKTGGEYRYSYTTLADVYDVCRELLAANGLSISQLPTDSDGNRVGLTTILMHESGEWLSTTSSMPGGQTAQDVGGALTYLRRYHLVSIVGVATEDDDAAQASGKDTQHTTIQRQQQVQRAATNGHTNGNGAASTGLATDKQLGKIRGLMRDHGWDAPGIVEWAAQFGIVVDDLDKLSRSQASTLIDELTKVTAE